MITVTLTIYFCCNINTPYSINDDDDDCSSDNENGKDKEDGNDDIFNMKYVI